MSQTDRQLTLARDLIKQKKYQQAHQLLVKLDHPLAEQWLQQVSMKLTETHSARDGMRFASPIGDDSIMDGTVISTLESKDMEGARIITGAMVGVVMALVASFFGAGVYLLLTETKTDYQLGLFPVLMATLIGVALALVMGIFRTSGPRVVFALAVFSGLMAYGSFRYAEYLDVVKYLEISGMTTEDFDEYLLEATDYEGFIGYMLITAKDGQPVARGQIIDLFDDFAPTMDTETTWLYWGFEALMMIIMPLIITSGYRKTRITSTPVGL